MHPGSVIANRFELEAVAGTGGMGTVYRALDRSTGTRVALKLLLRESIHAARFQREAELLAKLDHPGIVRYVAHGTPGSGPAFIAMEWVAGESLRERLARGALPAAEAVSLARRVAEALEVAHRNGIVHRDIKPENLMLAEADVDRVKVLDFGVALAPGAGQRMTRTGAPMGTIGYMAPEQVRGDSDVDARSDIFALGAVLFECLTGEPAFAANHPLAVLAKLVFEPPPRLRDLAPELPAALDEIVASMLEKEREHRPGTAGEVARALGELGADAARPAVSRTERRPSLTASERHVVSAIVGMGRGNELAATLPADHFHRRSLELERLAGLHGGRVEALGTTDFVVLFSSAGSAIDTAAAAARCALALVPVLEDTPLALVTGYTVAGGRLPVSAVVERAASSLANATGAGVRIDDVTAGLLPTRFVLGGSKNVLLLEAEREAAPPARLLLGRAVPCVGRDRELSTIEALFDECVEERVARAVLLSGPPGIGKSRIRHELMGRWVRRTPPPEVWIARPNSLTAGTPFALTKSLLSSAFGLADGAPELAKKKLMARVSRHVPADPVEQVAHFLGEALGLRYASNDRWLRAARQDAILMADQIQRAWEILLEHETRAHALVLVVEDLQWGDLPSVKLIDSALRKAAEEPLFVLALGRPEVHDAFPGLWSARQLHEIRVRDLPRRAAMEIARRALSPEVDDAKIARAVDTASGNALFLEELVRAFAEGRDETPESVVVMVQSRIEGLEPEARRVLRAASIFGDSFWSGAAASLVQEIASENVLGWIEALTEREILVRRAESRFPGEVELTFRNALLADAAYAMLTESDRELGHRLAAAWLESHGERDPKLLAEHYEKGRMPRAAVPWWERAAFAALDANDFVAARAAVERGVAAGADGQSLGALWVVEADALRWTGDLAGAARALERALELLQEGSPHWHHAVAEQALVMQRLGRADDLERLARRVMARAVRSNGSDGLAYAMARTALLTLIAGRRALADQLVALIADIERSGVALEAATRAQLAVYRALLALYRTDIGAYLAAEIDARHCFEEAGDLRRALNESTSIGFAHAELGAFAEAQRTLEQALADADELGLVHVKAAAWHNLGLVYSALGRHDDAKHVERRALDVFRAQQDRRLEGATLAYLAMIELAAGDIAPAAATARSAVELVEQVAPPIEPLARAILARVELESGDPEAALATASLARARLDAQGSGESAETWVRLVFAEAEEAAHGFEAARASFDEAKTRLMARAACIEDPELRRSFLENVPENKRTLDLAERYAN